MEASQTPWPRAWLMTDERMGDQLWAALERLPSGAGLVFRHYSLNLAERLELGLRIARFARRRQCLVAVGRSVSLAEEIGADLVHNPVEPTDRPFSCSVHDPAEARSARQAGASLIFVSPVFATRSHPERPALGSDRAIELASIVDCPAIALGGMSAERFRAINGPFYGYAGIDCWQER